MRKSFARILLATSVLSAGSFNVARAEMRNDMPVVGATGGHDVRDTVRTGAPVRLWTMTRGSPGGTMCRMGGFDPYQEGSRTSKPDPFTDGARNGKPDPFTDGARISSRDGYTEGNRSRGGNCLTQDLGSRSGGETV